MNSFLRKSFWLACLAFIAFEAGGPRVAHAEKTLKEEQAFFLSLEDIPLMPGLQELTDNTLTFDKPEGRIIESYALMNTATPAEVSAYYKQILPQFGWGPSGENRFFRGTEHLEISFEKQGPDPLVKILIRPSL